MKKIITAFILITGCTAAYGQFTLSGEIRPRTEYRHGYKTLIDTSQHGSVFTSQRSRLYFAYSSDKIKTGLVLQDVRTWGNQSQLNVYDVNTSSLHEAWGEYNFTNKISLKAGRQELSYDDERILGAVGWQQQARSHDAMLLKLTDDSAGCRIHIGGAYNQAGENNVAIPYSVINNYKEFYFLWMNKKIRNFSISVLEANNGYQSPVSVSGARFSYTAGTQVEYKKEALLINPRFYYQGGVDAGRKKIQAYMTGLDVQYALKNNWSIGLGAEMLSGQNQTDTTKSYKDIVHYFTPLYGTVHKFNGFMDYFYSGSGHGNTGLNDAYLRIKYKAEKWWVALDVHQFLANVNVLDTKTFITQGKIEAMSSSLGTEIDVTCLYNFSNQFSIQAGYSHMMATETMEVIKGGRFDEIQNWAYLMLSFRPAFLK